MSTSAMTAVRVRYEFRDGYHVFTSDDVYGLYVASKTPEVAFRRVPKAIELLVRMNEGFECKIQEMLTYEEFLSAAHRKKTRGARHRIRTAMRSREFALIQVAA